MRAIFQQKETRELLRRQIVALDHCGLCVKRCEIRVDLCDRGSAFTDARCYTLYRARADIADRENARTAGFEGQS